MPEWTGFSCIGMGACCKFCAPTYTRAARFDPIRARHGTLRPARLRGKKRSTMQIVWQRGLATVRDVYQNHQNLLKRRKTAYTTC